MPEYSDEVLTRVREPQRVGGWPTELADVGTGETGTLDDGTVTRIQVRVSGETVVEARFKVFGCSAAIASASFVAEWLEGASIDDVRNLKAEHLVAALKLAPEREYVGRMAVDAGQSAVANWSSKSEC